MTSTPTTQTIIDTWQAQVEQDAALTNAQKAQIQSHLYAIAVIALGKSSTYGNGHSG
jgi:hypothetical protein